MALLLWCVCGGFLLHMLECNYLSILLKPSYAKPVDTAEDILNRGITIIFIPGQEGVLSTMKNSPSKVTRELAEKIIVAKVIF